MGQSLNRQPVFLIYVALVLAILIAFEPIRLNDFVSYDDHHYVTENPHVNNGITGRSVIWAFTTSHSANWHPLTWLSHMLDCQLFGLVPFWHHMTNLLFHIVNTLLLFWILKRMTGAVWPSGFVAAVFALHPLHVESVAWVAERKDVLSGFFWMLTIAAYIRYVEHPAIKRYLLVVFVFCLGLMAKPMLVTLPFVLLLLDYWPLGRFQWGHQSNFKDLQQSEPANTGGFSLSIVHLTMEKIPLLVLAAASSVITYIVQQNAGALSTIEKVPLNFRIVNALASYVGYIGKMIYPSRLAVLYPLHSHQLPTSRSIISFLILAGISAAVVYIGRHRRYFVTGWLWYLGTLVPVIGLIQVGAQAMADRYTYLPSIGITIMVSWGLAEFTAKWRYRKVGLQITAGLLLVAMLICTRMQVRYWRNSFTLYEHTLAVTENNSVIHNYYGITLFESGQLDAAFEHYKQALQINPQYSAARNNIGQVFLKQQKLDKAIACFNQVLHDRTDWHDTYYNLGLAYAQKGELELAVQNYSEALRVKPDYPEALNNWAAVLKKQGKIDKAIRKWKRALELKPDHAGAHYNIGLAMSKQGNDSQAIKHLNEALRIKPDWPTAHSHLGNIYYKQGRFNLAISHWTKTVKLKPDSADILNNLAWILATVEDTKLANHADAVKYAERACELTNYKQPEFLDTLAAAYAAAGKKNLAQQIRNRLQLYQTGQPYHKAP